VTTRHRDDECDSRCTDLYTLESSNVGNFDLTNLVGMLY